MGWREVQRRFMAVRNGIWNEMAVCGVDPKTISAVFRALYSGVDPKRISILRPEVRERVEKFFF